MSLKQNVFHVRKMTNSIHFTFSSTMGNIDDACEQTTSYLRSKIEGIEKQLFPVNLVIREGLTNAIRHGNRNDPGKMVIFLLTIVKNESIKLMIQDEGKGFDWRKQKAKDPLENQDHGRGITIMETYFSRYCYNEKGNILYLEKAILS